jgi:hypothetical protein
MSIAAIRLNMYLDLYLKANGRFLLIVNIPFALNWPLVVTSSTKFGMLVVHILHGTPVPLMCTALNFKPLMLIHYCNSYLIIRPGKTFPGRIERVT